ncbi:MAG: glyoxalase, partial [Firmicutes bacterium]|nr:glyoxalase [Bacillota bacterium]
GMKLELLQKPYMNVSRPPYSKGYTHIAIKLGSKDMVDDLTKKITDAGFALKIKPRVTTDGQYSSCVYDPDDNEIELTE